MKEQRVRKLMESLYIILNNKKVMMQIFGIVNFL